VGGPAYNDAKAAEEVLAKLDVPYVAAHPVEFQTLDQWGGSDRGLLPVENQPRSSSERPAWSCGSVTSGYANR
jgi:cobalamin biosynthesis Mg chelatase CobN